ncbi:hypothetical protein [Paenibacillus eucommiae]|uniref:Ferric iron reductase protein FhuF n=1 Tax=Paenibacillus eucommiae TaxID=1355755 RepID=A0ABS4IQN5_9BACL|nr:hypothetical protein [Paenibacillus eucommiae]MBP1989888.1 ferric iron reductase protein FhuF [Paenibacillus eucommiae]
MGQQMEAVDFKLLEEKFFLTLHEPESIQLSMPASELLETEPLMKLIDLYGPLIKTSERSVAAAFFCSWYAGLCCAMQHMLVHNKEVILDLSLSNLSVQLYMGSQYPLFSFRMNEVRFINIPKVDREAWCRMVLHSFYKNQVRPMIAILSDSAQMRVHPLWGQISNALYNQREEALAAASETLDEKSRDRIMDHFGILTHGVDASAFGLRKNPFDSKLTFIESQNDPTQMVSIKPACCLIYRLDLKIGYCYECPRLKEKDRVALRL